MRVQMACSQFHGLPEHDAERDVFDAEFMGYLQRLADVVAIFHEGLLGQRGVA